MAKEQKALACVPFYFDGAEVPVVMPDGEARFVGNDVCKRLGYANASDAMTNHCKGVAKRYPLMTPGGVQRFRVITRSDVLRLVMNSELPAAQRFEKWVLDEVLPTIMETGSYIGGQFDLTEADKSAIGGMVKGILAKQFGETMKVITEQGQTIMALKKRIEAGHDPTQNVVTDWFTMHEILEKQRAHPKGRRGFSIKCSARLRRWCHHKKREGTFARARHRPAICSSGTPCGCGWAMKGTPSSRRTTTQSPARACSGWCRR